MINIWDITNRINKHPQFKVETELHTLIRTEDEALIAQIIEVVATNYQKFLDADCEIQLSYNTWGGFRVDFIYGKLDEQKLDTYDARLNRNMILLTELGIDINVFVSDAQRYFSMSFEEKIRVAMGAFSFKRSPHAYTTDRATIIKVLGY